MPSNWFIFSAPLIIAVLLISCASTVKPSAYTVQKDLVYKTVDGVALQGDLFLPEGPALKPAVLVIHGGGWSKKSGDMESVCISLAKAGYVAFSPTYRLAPQHHFPEALADVQDSLTWLKSKAKEYRIDTEKIAGWGYSAGGHLVLMAGLDPKMGLKAIVSGGTPADLTAWPKSEMVKDFIGASYNDKPDFWKQASPVFNVKADSPPVYLYHGKLDTIVDYNQMEKMRDALLAKNRSVETHTSSFMGHVGVYFLSQESVDLGIEFIGRQIGNAKVSRLAN